MFRKAVSKIGSILRGLMTITGDEKYPRHYQRLRINIVILMLLVTIIPLIAMGIINQYQYFRILQDEIIAPVNTLVLDKKRSFELFLTERLSAVSFVASAYTFDDLADEKKLNRVFRVMKEEFGGFVDLGVCDNRGLQVSYVGPYDLKGKQYANQEWFQEVQIRDHYVSDVFMGYRKFPHFVIAVKHFSYTDEEWILRATIDTGRFNDLIVSSGLDAETDAFLVNYDGVLQTPSKFNGAVMEKLPFSVPPPSFEPTVIDSLDAGGREVLLAYAYFTTPRFVLMVTKPRADVLKAWYTLRSDLLFVLIGGTLVIFVVVYRLTGAMVQRIKEADQKRTQIFHEMEYTNKLASIGRLAAGVAHEVNNPMAIIDQKAGLMMDLIEMKDDFPEKDKFLSLTDSVLHSVDRCRTITHRLLGFARRMDVQIEVIDLNQIIHEVIGFLEKEAFHRNVDIQLQLAENPSMIASDRGQLQQVFLNILNNAFEAVGDRGRVVITSWEHDLDTVGVSFQDDGAGMSKDVLKHIFEPFFSTKKGSGTGLGLSITYGIVKKLGGTIDVKSKPASGTTFTIFLPKKGIQAEDVRDGNMESALSG